LGKSKQNFNRSWTQKSRRNVHCSIKSEILKRVHEEEVNQDVVERYSEEVPTLEEDKVADRNRKGKTRLQTDRNMETSLTPKTPHLPQQGLKDRVNVQKRKTIETERSLTQTPPVRRNGLKKSNKSRRQLSGIP
jgi:hypothetical protein